MRAVFFPVLALVCVSSTLAGPVGVGDTGVKIEVPSGFQPLLSKLVAKKWPGYRDTKFAVGDPANTTVLLHDGLGPYLTQEKLEDFRQALTGAYEAAVPGIIWRRNEIVRQSGRKWILLEMTSRDPDNDLHRIVMITGHQGKMLNFTVISTKEEFPKQEAALRKSLGSITLPE